MTTRPTGPKEPSILASPALVIELADVPVPAWALEIRPHAWWLRDRLAIDLVLGAQGHRVRAIVGMALLSYYSGDESITPAESRMIDAWAKSLSSDQVETIADIGASIADELVDLVDRLHGHNHHPVPDEATWQKTPSSCVMAETIWKPSVTYFRIVTLRSRRRRISMTSAR
ncbi:MAG: hypothetical protein JWL80_610 [Parcubacteria group bacterium]|nr:hypothetical protein [Parcubacteria group bacterium]